MPGWAVAVVAAFAQTAPQAASALVDAGVALSNQGRFQEAGDKFVQALAADPNFAEAHYLLGLVRQQDGRYEAARSSFHAAVKINPRYKEAQARVCELDSREAGRTEKGYAAALAACRLAARLAPADPEPRYHAGWNLSRMGNAAAAIAELQAALKLDPAYREAQFELGRLYLDFRDPARAVPLLQAVTAAEPKNANARFLLGSALARQGDCAGAVGWLETGAENAQKYFLLAGCYRKMNRAEDAAAAFAKVKEFRQSADARMQAKYLAAIAHQKGQAGETEEAIAAYRAALSFAPDPTIRIDLAVALLKKGDAAEVLTLLDGATGPLERYQTALALSRLGRNEEAGAVLDGVVRDAPKFAEAWYHRGVIFIALGRTSDAEKAFGTAVRLRPDEGAMRAAWAGALEKLGRTAEAAEQRRLGQKLPK